MIKSEIVFRTDASREIGTGHVMRCLALAEALKERGANCRFVCREHVGNMLEQIRERGFEAYSLPSDPEGIARSCSCDASILSHAAWLGAHWTTDARQSSAAIGNVKIDWLIVDHYGLDISWEKALRHMCCNLMVIDDLTDRSHDCDLLLNQNLGQKSCDYVDLVPDACILLTGPRYALLRPEFARLRDYSLQRREIPKLDQLLIAMGGVDLPNATGQVLEILKGCVPSDSCRIIVALGPQAPWLKRTQRIMASLPWAVELRVNSRNMAQLMADSDLAIGAAGSTSWERCCLGLPTLLVVLAGNQRTSANALHHAKAAVVVESFGTAGFDLELRNAFSDWAFDQKKLKEASRAASRITEGKGATLLVEYLLGKFAS